MDVILGFPFHHHSEWLRLRRAHVANKAWWRAGLSVASETGAGLGAPSGQILALSLPGPGSPAPEPLRARGSSSGSQVSLMRPRGERKSPLGAGHQGLSRVAVSGQS